MLVKTFELSTFGRAPAKFSDDELHRVNAAIVHQLEYADVADRLPEGMDAAAWHAIRPNLEKVPDAGEWWAIVKGPVAKREFDAETRAYIAEAANTLAWSDNPWGELTDSLKVSTGRKGKALFLPLRQALTGLDHGPEMKELLPLIGEDEARARLLSAATD